MMRPKAVLVLVIAITLSAQSTRESIRFGVYDLYIGQDKFEVLDTLKKSYKLAPITDDGVLVVAPRDSGSLTIRDPGFVYFEGNKLSLVRKNWGHADQLFAATHNMTAQGTRSLSCTLKTGVTFDDTGDRRTIRLLCGNRSLVFEEGTIHGLPLSDVSEGLH